MLVWTLEDGGYRDRKIMSFGIGIDEWIHSSTQGIRCTMYVQQTRAGVQSPLDRTPQELAEWHQWQIGTVLLPKPPCG